LLVGVHRQDLPAADAEAAEVNSEEEVRDAALGDLAVVLQVEHPALLSGGVSRASRSPAAAALHCSGRASTLPTLREALASSFDWAGGTIASFSRSRSPLHDAAGRTI